MRFDKYAKDHNISIFVSDILGRWVSCTFLQTTRARLTVWLFGYWPLQFRRFVRDVSLRSWCYFRESRRQTAEWIVCIAGRDDSSLSTRTAYFAIALFDAFFHTNISSERPSGLNKATPYYVNSKWPCQSHSVLVGACCLHIASKCEDVSYAGIRDISLSLNEE